MRTVPGLSALSVCLLAGALLAAPQLDQQVSGGFNVSQRVFDTNYLAVVVEGFALPLVHGAWLTALLFTVLNALLLRVRIRCEEEALARHCGEARQLDQRPRLIPGVL